MLTLRYHVVSLAAVLVALAVGVVLGSTSVSQRLLSVVAGDRGELSEQVRDLTGQRDALRSRQRAADSFAAAVAPTVVRGQLEHRSVVLVIAGDVPVAEQAAVRQLLDAAGATLTGEVELTDAVIDPARADQLRDLTTRLLPSGAQLPTATDAGGLLGGLLGDVLLVAPRTGKAQAAPDQAAAALAGLTGAGFVKPGARPARAQLALVLSGGPATGFAPAERAATLARLATELDRAGGGAVLAGDAGSAGPVGAVGVARAEGGAAGGLSTVDDAQSPVGQVAAVLALREQANGHAGRYGEAPTAKAAIPGQSAG
jgi:hypothetical protein